MVTLSPALKTEILKLFREKFTVNQIAARLFVLKQIKIDPKEILLFLTKEGCWSRFCSSCVIKDCYNCKGLEEFGKPISVQDRIDFTAQVKNAKNKA